MKNIEDSLRSYVNAVRPIIYINYFDSHEVSSLIRKTGGQNIRYIEYNSSFGMVDFRTKQPIMECDLHKFLQSTIDYGFEGDTFLILDNADEEMSKPQNAGFLRKIAERDMYEDEYYCIVFIISANSTPPTSIADYATVVDYSLPDDAEIESIIKDFDEANEWGVKDDDLGDLILTLKGLNRYQISEILKLALSRGAIYNRQARDFILQEKTQFIKKSGLLEVVPIKESVDDIGGLLKLKEWLKNKAYVYNHLDKAIRYGVDTPKGLLIVGMPGCGKSLTAKATAALFNVPLVRLDLGRLLGKYVGDSEGNMRKALSLAEAISPCVLWVDELEKAFAGVGGSEVTTRLFGQFLTWLQEKESMVFIVATANDISSIPPELMRKGRFDEIFFVDLPSLAERKKILEIHLKKRGKYSGKIDLAKVSAATSGYNGADIESIVSETVERCFIKNLESVSTDNLLETVKTTKSISDTMGEKLKNIKKIVTAMNLKNAN